jgi:hypothetical protein
MIRHAILITAALALACQQEPIAVKQGAGVNDYNLGKLKAAVAKFVAAGRTAPAFAELARTMLELRPGFDRSTAEQAELSLVVLALDPVKAVADKPMSEQVATLALTVWPALLAKELEADEILRRRDPRADEVLPAKDETPAKWVERVCGTALAADCKQIVPEYQGYVVAALATRRGAERSRNAVADCLLCANEPGWKQAVAGWEDLDHKLTSSIADIERRAAPDNWPMAGAASQPDPGLPEAEIASTGEIVVGGERFGAAKRIEALRDARFMKGGDSPLALQLQPDLTIAQVKGILSDVRKSGAKKMAVVARTTVYPWERRIYWVSDTGGIKVGLRQTDSLQLLLHAVDHLGESGATVWVD